jgi:hypothetical protein
MKAINANPVYDQFALSDQVGIITSSRMMKVLRHLRTHGPLTEGILANKCGEKIFLKDWSDLVRLLTDDFGYISSELSGRGLTKLFSLTEKAEAFLEDRLGPKEPEQVTEAQPTE